MTLALADLRTEVLNKGFDAVTFSARINQYLNDAQNMIARRVNYYVDEAAYQFTTVGGTDTYPWPTDFARIRSLFDVDRRVELEFVLLRQIDRSGGNSGAPAFYANSGANVRLYPTPDSAYNLELRYWKMPTAMVADTDVPSVPNDWAHMLWCYATWMCYESEDDAQMGQYWKQRFQEELSMFAADQKFPDSDGPNQAQGMWEADEMLGRDSWSLYGSGY